MDRQIQAKEIDELKVSKTKIIMQIADELHLKPEQIDTTVSLITEGNTIPFISRYRKEMTGSMTETEVRETSHRFTYLENLENRKIDISRAIFEQKKLTRDLFNNIFKCSTVTELEALYAPYKKKKKTKAMIAVERGLEPLAEFILTAVDENLIHKEAKKYIDPEKEIKTAGEAIEGASDILAERFSQNIEHRKNLKDFIFSTGKISCEGKKDKETSSYQMYYDYEESLNTLPPHRILAINRGEREKELSSHLVFDDEKAFSGLISEPDIANETVRKAYADGFKRLLLPSVQREIRHDLAEKADRHGISVFSENVRALLMQSPIKRTAVLAVDPGIRTGTKITALDDTGKYLGSDLIFQRNTDQAKKKMISMIHAHQIKLIAIGNGTGSHDVQEIVSEMIRECDMDIHYTVVSEDGASVYSASQAGVEEFPDLDVTVRGAISIGRRIQDPLAELVKIDPKSLGVGLYQHDLNQKALSSSLDEVVESVVNQVGVDVNTASYALLRYVSGISRTLSRNIVEFRDQFGKINSRDQLKKIPGFGNKTYEQAAGFLRIPESPNPLDNTWVHPENYSVAEKIFDNIKQNQEIDIKIRKKILEEYQIGETTLKDIIDELKKPGRDPREDYPAPVLQKGVVRFEDLKTGMKVNGKVKNVVDFGAFIDIGIKETALVHISEMSDRFVENPSDILSVGDVKEFSIISIDEKRKRIGLSLKSDPFSKQKTDKSKP